MIISRSNTAAAVAVLSTLVAALLVAARPAAAATPQCPEFTPYAQTVFSHSTQIDNQMLPLTPGIRTILDGTVNDDQRPARGPSRELHGDRRHEGHPGRAARSSSGTSTSTRATRGSARSPSSRSGPRTTRATSGTWASTRGVPRRDFAGAPSTWLAGFDEAQPGVHMFPDPKVTSKWSLQGFAPRIDFEDCQAA
jgi:hypothetical protein